MTLLTLMGLSACTEEPSTQSVLSVLEADTPVAIVAIDTVGTAPLDVLVRAENEYGAAVPAGPATVTLTSAFGAVLLDPTVSFNATGYGTVVVDTPSTAHTATLTVDSSDDGAEIRAEAAVTLLERRAPNLNIGPGAVLPPEAGEPGFVAQGTRGFALATSNEVWWKPADVDQPPHRVAVLPDAITGMEGGDIDADGVVDLVVWGGGVAIALRGRDSGGYTWAGGWSVAEGRSIIGVNIADLDADRLVDLAIGVTDGIDGWVEAVYGDGAWAFESRYVLELNYPLESISALDEDRDGRPDVTTLSASTGWIQRYIRADAGWVQGGPSEFVDANGTFEAPPGSRLLPSRDLNLDRKPDIILNESPGAGSHNLVFFILGDVPTKFDEAYTAYNANLADLDQDGAADLMILEDDQLRIISWDEETLQFVADGVTGVGTSAPVVASQITNDLVLDLAIVSTFAKVYEGSLVENEETSAIDYELRTWEWASHQFPLAGPFAVVDFNGGGGDDVVGFSTNNGNLRVDAWRQDAGDGGTAFTEVSGFGLGDKLIGHSIEACGNNIWGLAGDGVESELFGINTSSSGASQSGSEAVSGSLLACGDTADAWVVVASTAGAWSAFDTSLNEVDSGDLGSTGDIAVAALDDGSGTAVTQVIHCLNDGCSILAADLDGDGFDEVATSDQGSITVDGWGQRWEVPGNGELSVGDLDQDGRLDILATDDLTGRIVVLRGVEGGIAPPAAWYTDREIYGRTLVGDFFGADGRPELAMEGAEGTFLHSPGTTDTVPLD